MIRHVVAWTLSAEDADQRAADAAEMTRLLRALDGVVPSIRSLTVGPNIAYPEQNADIALVLDVDDIEGLTAYQTHPAHQEVVGFVRGVVSGRMSVDFEI